MSKPEKSEALKRAERYHRVGAWIGRAYAGIGLVVTVALPFLLSEHQFSAAIAFFILWFGGFLFISSAFLAPNSLRNTKKMRRRRVNDVLDHAADRYIRIFMKALQSGDPEAYLDKNAKRFDEYYNLRSMVQKLARVVGIFYVVFVLIVGAAFFFLGQVIGWEASLLQSLIFSLDAVSKGMFLDVLEGFFPSTWHEQFGTIGHSIAVAVRSFANILIFLAAARILYEWRISRDVSFARKLAPSEAAFQKSVKDRIIIGMGNATKGLPQQHSVGLTRTAQAMLLPRVFGPEATSETSGSQ